MSDSADISSAVEHDGRMKSSAARRSVAVFFIGCLSSGINNRAVFISGIELVGKDTGNSAAGSLGVFTHFFQVLAFWLFYQDMGASFFFFQVNGGGILHLAHMFLHDIK